MSHRLQSVAVAALGASLLSALAIAGSGSSSPNRVLPPGSESRCTGVQSSGEIKFQGRRLLESPDVQEPEIRLANALLSNQCVEEAEQILREFSAAHPDNYHVYLVMVRETWIGGAPERARAMAENLWRRHPEFTSMALLLASLHLQQHDNAGALPLLSAVEKTHPEDLWAFIDRLKIEADLTPTRDTATTLRAIISDPQFPANVRAEATNIFTQALGGVSEGERQQAFRAGMSVGSGTSGDLLYEQAVEVVELHRDPKGGTKLIESYLRSKGGAVASLPVRVMLAEGYLLQASALSPHPSPATAALEKQARDALGGDFTWIALRTAGRPFLNPVLPFLSSAVDVSQVDEYGQTMMCSALRMLNVDAIKAALDWGTDPNAACGDQSLVRAIVRMPTARKPTERQAALRELLSRGAKVEGIEWCQSPDNGDCKDVLLPVLQEYQERRTNSVRSF